MVVVCRLARSWRRESVVLDQFGQRSLTTAEVNGDLKERKSFAVQEGRHSYLYSNVSDTGRICGLS